jgi:putative intracellular protease/amidase
MQKITLCFLAFLLLANCSKNENKENILIVTSNQHTYGNSNINASNHFAEIVLAYDVFVKNGYSIDFISPKGGAIPIGYIATSDPIQKKYLYNNEFMNILKNTKKPSEIDPKNYKAIYYSGGGAAMFGIAENSEIKKIAEQIYNQNGIISTVCHGTAGIVNLKDNQGNSLFQNKKISGYPDLFENKEAEYYKTFPFSIEDKINENKGSFLHSQKQRDNFYIIDGKFITGQDPSATTSVAQKVVETLINQ